MTWTIELIERIQHLFPKQRGHVMIDYLTFFQALPAHFGNWNTIYYRFRYWADTGVFDRIEKHLMSQAIAIKGVKALSLDSTYVKVHPDGTGALKKNGPQSIGKSRGGWTTKIHSIVADDPARMCKK